MDCVHRNYLIYMHMQLLCSDESKTHCSLRARLY